MKICAYGALGFRMDCFVAALLAMTKGWHVIASIAKQSIIKSALTRYLRLIHHLWHFDLNMQIFDLLWHDFTGCLHKQILRLLIHWERGNFANIRLIG